MTGRFSNTQQEALELLEATANANGGSVACVIVMRCHNGKVIGMAGGLGDELDNLADAARHAAMEELS